MDKMREEFEKWISSYIGKSWLEKSQDDLDDYKDDNTQFMWESWQASRSTLCVELPENCEGMALTVTELHKQLDKAGVSYK